MLKVIFAIEGLIIVILVAVLVVFQIRKQDNMFLPANVPAEDKTVLYQKYDSQIEELKKINEELNQKFEAQQNQQDKMALQYQDDIKSYDSRIQALKEESNRLSRQYEDEISRLKMDVLQKAIAEELLKRYEAEVRSLRETNAALAQKREAEINKLKDELTQNTESLTQSAALDKNKAVLAVLKKLQSVTDLKINRIIDEDDPTTFFIRNTRMSYRDYFSKVVDAKIEFDKCLEEAKETLPGSAKKTAIKAMECYQDALYIWDMEADQNPDMKKDRDDILRDLYGDKSKNDPKDKPRPKPMDIPPVAKDPVSKAKQSAFYIDKYFMLGETPYSAFTSGSRVLVPLKAVPALWDQALKYIEDTEKAINNR